MTDNSLIALFGNALLSGFTDIGISVNLVQAYEPTNQGANSAATVYFQKLLNKRYGFTGRNSRWDTLTNTMIYDETQVIETTFQINALVRQNPSSLSYTASDIVNFAAAIMSSSKMIRTLQAAGVGIYRITEIRNPYFVDDRGQYEASPSFDFTLSHNQDIITTAPIVQSIDYNFTRI